jgi:DNA-binding MarR family transcriptional regulator
MSDQEWYTQEEIAQLLGVELKKLYPRVNALRNAKVINWKINPNDQRSILIHKDSIDTLKDAMLAN